jgi:hypothetical protein
MITGYFDQIGSDINGVAPGDALGYSVCLNSTGSIVAVASPDSNTSTGMVNIYQYDTINGWQLLGSTINGDNSGDMFGSSISMNSDGKTIAIGALNSKGDGQDRGLVKIYKYTTDWDLIGTFQGDNDFDYLGRSVSLNATGTIVAIGAHGVNGDGTNRGFVRVYEYSSGSWTSLGDIIGESDDDLSGINISLNSTGYIVAIGAPYNDGTTGNDNDNRGHVRVYQYSNGTWGKIGNDIDGIDTNDNSGWSVSMNSDGQIVTIGAPGNNTQTGYVKVYQYTSGTWELHGTTISGTSTNQSFGTNVSMSSDGSIIAIRSNIDNGDGTFYDVVNLYQFNGVNWDKISETITGTTYGEYSGTGESIYLSSDGSTLAYGDRRYATSTGY